MYVAYLYVKCIYVDMYIVCLRYSYIIQQVRYNSAFKELLETGGNR